MRLYTRTGATALKDPETGTEYQADDLGSFMLPEELAEQLVSFHIGGQPAWETEIQRQRRLMAEDLERRRDPATMMDAVQQLVNAARSVAPAPEAPPAPAKAGRPRKVPAAQ